MLKNFSNRGYVGTGASIMIPGLTVSPEGPKTFLVRVVGPALGQPPFNLTGVLEDPRLTVFSDPDAILTNDNWGDSPDATGTAIVEVYVVEQDQRPERRHSGVATPPDESGYGHPAQRDCARESGTLLAMSASIPQGQGICRV